MKRIMVAHRTYRGVVLGRYADARLSIGHILAFVVAVLAAAVCFVFGGGLLAAADPVPAVTLVTNGWTYDGTAHTVVEVAEGYAGAYAVTYYAADRETVVTADAIVGAGVYYVSVEAEAEGDYAAVTINRAPVTITPRPITVEISPAMSVYGEPVAPLSAAVAKGTCIEGDATPYALSVDVTPTSPVGAYDVAGAVVDSNYAIAFTGCVGAYSVTPRLLSLAWDGIEFVYDGIPHLPTALFGNVVEGDVLAPVLSGTATNAGVYTATVLSAGNSNYVLPTRVSTGFRIDKAEATFDLSGAVTEFRYTGETFSLSGVVTSGPIAYEGLNAFREVGVYEVTVVSAATPNYYEGRMTVTVTVREMAPTVDEATGALAYRKVLHPDEAATTGADMTAVFLNAYTEASDTPATLTALVGDTTLTFDAAAIAALAGNDVRLYWRTVSPSSDRAADYPVVDGARLFLDVAVEPADLGKGTVTVSFPFRYTAHKNEALKVYALTDEGEWVDCHATRRDGRLTFAADRLTRFVVLTEPKLSSGAVAGLVVGCVVGGLALMFAFYFFLVRPFARKSLTEK